MINVLLAEDNEVVRRGLTTLLNNTPDISVIGQAANGREVIGLLEAGAAVDIVLADLNMPEMDGIELTAHLAQYYQSVRVVILTMHSKRVYMERALEAGAKGYVLKYAEMDELLCAIRQVFEGETYFY